MSLLGKNSSQITRVNLGCGLNAPEGWCNYDSSLHAQLVKYPSIYAYLSKLNILNKGSNWPKNVKYINLNKKLPFETSSIDVVYNSHVFEHLNSKSADHFLRETLRVLKPGGILRIVVPDLYYHAKKYIENYDKERATQEFLYVVNLSRPEDQGIIKKIYNIIMGYPSIHKTMYDNKTLYLSLANKGFVDIINCEYGKSNYIDHISEIEATEGYEGSLYLEARKNEALY